MVCSPRALPRPVHFLRSGVSPHKICGHSAKSCSDARARLRQCERMQASTLRLLKILRPNLRRRWEVRLRSIPPTSPLANPNTLVFMMDRTLDQIFINKPKKGSTETPPVSTHHRDELCACGLNPLLAYFASAERALIECEAEMIAATPPVFSSEEIHTVISAAKIGLARLAQCEVETFCSLCQRRSDRPAGHVHEAVCDPKSAKTK